MRYISLFLPLCLYVYRAVSQLNHLRMGKVVYHCVQHHMRIQNMLIVFCIILYFVVMSVRLPSLKWVFFAVKQVNNLLAGFINEYNAKTIYE